MTHDRFLPAVEIEPAEPARSTVIWLHGLGADGHDFEPIVPYVGVDPKFATRFIFPHAPGRPVTINGGMVMPAWYDIRELSLTREVDHVGGRESADQIRALIDRERERGIPSDRLVLAGFSQGGALAVYVGLRSPEAFAGLIGLSTYLLDDGSLDGERSEPHLTTPIFQAHGELDPMVPLAAGTLAHDRLVELGYRVEWKS
jgi:phospholipase/carboxylesterase